MTEPAATRSIVFPVSLLTRLRNSPGLQPRGDDAGWRLPYSHGFAGKAHRRVVDIMRALSTGARVHGRRGVAALEFVLIAPGPMLMLLSLVDLGVAAMQFIASYKSLRVIASYATSNPPANVLNTTGYLSGKLPTGVSVSVFCNGAACTPTNAASFPKSFEFTRSVTLKAIVVPGLAGTYTLNYWDRFE